MSSFDTRLIRRRALVALVLGLVLLAPANGAKKGEIFTLTDPSGDSRGDGTLVYPVGADLRPDDLDIVAFSAQAESGGTVFEATFARPIRLPSMAGGGRRGTILERVAKLGFYTFNIDVYIDTDRVPGSGSTVTLPGRGAAIAAANAWEKAVCLTPRPNEARELLKRIYEERAKQEVRTPEGSIATADAEKISSDVAQKVASTVYFPTFVWVSGRQIRFFVPDSFLGGPARATWSYVVAVSGADITNTDLDLPTPSPGEKPAPETLMIIPVGHLKSSEHFGSRREENALQPALLDIIVPAGMSQEEVLEDYSPAQGRLVQLPGVVPADQESR
jgi:hypothetical protein